MGSIIVSSGVTSSGLALKSTSMYVKSGGTASDTTLNLNGFLYVSNGGVANDTAVNSAGHLYVFSGGVANDTEVAANGELLVSSMGVASNVNVDSFGYLEIASKGSALGIRENGGWVAFDDGATVSFEANSFSDLVLKSRKANLHSGTTANSTTLNLNGFLYVSNGGVANDTAVNSAGHLYVFSGGTANDTEVAAGGELLVSSMGVAKNVCVNSFGYLAVASKGSALGIRENGGWVEIDNGATVSFEANSFSDLVLKSRKANLHSGTTANSTTLNLNGSLYVSNGGVANDTLVNSAGTLYVLSGGTANNTEVASRGELYVYNGAEHRGSLQIASGGTVKFTAGAKLDFTVSEQTAPATALVNDWSRITGGSQVVYTITVKANQTNGTYQLAGGADGFSNTVTVKTDTATLGTVTVGSTLKTTGKEYTLNCTGGNLSLTVSGVVAETVCTYTGNFSGKGGGAFQLMSDGSACIRTKNAKTQLSGTVDTSKWEVVGAGDFNGSGKDGLLWVEKATGYVYMQYDMTSLAEINNKTNCLGVLGEGYSLKGAGDFTGNGIAGALLQGPAFGDPEFSLNYGLPVWARNDDGSTFNGWLGALVNTWQEGDSLRGDLSDPASINANNYQYKVVGIGDFNGDGRDDVMLQNTMPEVVTEKGVDYTITGSGDVFTFLTGSKAGIKRGDAPTVCYAGCATDGWEVLGFGDFDADGIDDTLLSDGTGLAGWKMANGQRQDNFWFGNLSADEEFAGIADFNNDGTDDILVRNTSTETLTAWTVEDGAVTGKLAIK